jgi:predicted HTH domain antitoxin
MSQFTIDLPSHVPADEARLLLSIKLYEDKRISLGKAAEMAGYSKRAFMDVLSEKDIPVINISPEDLDRELDG